MDNNYNDIKQIPNSKDKIEEFEEAFNKQNDFKTKKKENDSKILSVIINKFENDFDLTDVEVNKLNRINQAIIFEELLKQIKEKKKERNLKKATETELEHLQKEKENLWLQIETIKKESEIQKASIEEEARKLGHAAQVAMQSMQKMLDDKNALIFKKEEQIEELMKKMKIEKEFSNQEQNHLRQSILQLEQKLAEKPMIVYQKAPQTIDQKQQGHHDILPQIQKQMENKDAVIAQIEQKNILLIKLIAELQKELKQEKSRAQELADEIELMKVQNQPEQLREEIERLSLLAKKREKENQELQAGMEQLKEQTQNVLSQIASRKLDQKDIHGRLLAENKNKIDLEIKINGYLTKMQKVNQELSKIKKELQVAKQEGNEWKIKYNKLLQTNKKF